MQGQKQRGAEMTKALRDQLLRHAKRLVELAPDNPASFEIVAHVEMTGFKKADLPEATRSAEISLAASLLKHHSTP